MFVINLNLFATSSEYQYYTFGWDSKPRSSVCTHAEDHARTI